jgi:nucleoside-diphosphate-sugar epimerase
MKRVIITGASGFLGRALASRLFCDHFHVFGVCRTIPKDMSIFSTLLNITIDSRTNWVEILRADDVVVHLAARAHLPLKGRSDKLDLFREVNVNATLNLARQAAISGCRRFIYVSSIGVNGDSTCEGRLFKPDDCPEPKNAYALSKAEAEIGLRKIAQETGLDIVIIRPPLIYGPNAPGNCGALVKAIQRRWILPLGAIRNIRSFISLRNMVDFLFVCITNPAAEGHTFLVSDGQDMSTIEFIRGIAKSANVPCHLVYFPLFALDLLGRFSNKSPAVKSLTSSLQLDIEKTYSVLGWSPPQSVDDGLRETIL